MALVYASVLMTADKSDGDMIFVVSFPTEESYRKCKAGGFRDLPVAQILKDLGRDMPTHRYTLTGEMLTALPRKVHHVFDRDQTYAMLGPSPPPSETNPHRELVAACWDPKKQPKKSASVGF